MNVDINNVVSKADEKKFIDFYNGLDKHENIFYMYFSSNLMHYVIEQLSLIPENVNLVLIGGGLSDYDIILFKKISTRPYCILQEHYHDATIWNTLMKHNLHNFGWVDVDCFIYNPLLFEETTHFTSSDILINTVWVRKHERYKLNLYTACTFFLFINIKAAKMIFEKYDKMTMYPVIYGPVPKSLGYEIYEELDKNQAEYIFRNYVTTDFIAYDTTHYFQIISNIEGYKIHRIRNLDILSKYYSAEAMHLGGSHMIHNYTLNNGPERIWFRFNMRFSYFLLKKYLPLLPEPYLMLEDIFRNNLIRNNVNSEIDDIKSKINSYSERYDINKNVMNITNTFDTFKEGR